MDPRERIIEKRLSGIGRILVFAGGKGGVGKSSCAAVASLLLAKRGLKTGLLDMDFQGATDHILLGVKPDFPEEEYGILPHEVDYGLKFMSISFFTGEHGVALRGDSVSEAMREISAVTIWGELDALILDMPPGLGDELLDILRFVPRSEMIVVTTPSVLSLRVAERLVRFLAGTETEAVGAVLNMESGENRPLQTPAGIPLLCTVPYVGGFEKEIGKPSLLTEGRFAEHMVEGLTALQLF